MSNNTCKFSAYAVANIKNAIADYKLRKYMSIRSCVSAYTVPQSTLRPELSTSKLSRAVLLGLLPVVDIVITTSRPARFVQTTEAIVESYMFPSSTPRPFRGICCEVTPLYATHACCFVRRTYQAYERQLRSCLYISVSVTVLQAKPVKYGTSS